MSKSQYMLPCFRGILHLISLISLPFVFHLFYLESFLLVSFLLTLRLPGSVLKPVQEIIKEERLWAIFSCHFRVCRMAGCVQLSWYFLMAVTVSSPGKIRDGARCCPFKQNCGSMWPTTLALLTGLNRKGLLVQQGKSCLEIMPV